MIEICGVVQFVGRGCLRHCQNVRGGVHGAEFPVQMVGVFLRTGAHTGSGIRKIDLILAGQRDVPRDAIRKFHITSRDNGGVAGRRTYR